MWNPYEYFDQRCDLYLLCGYIAENYGRKEDPVLAFTLGQLKVEGDIDKALKLKDFVKENK